MSEARRTQIIIASVADKLKQSQSASIEERCQKVESYASELYEIAYKRLEEVVIEIKLSLHNLVSEMQVFTVVSPSDGSKSHYHRYQIVEIAKQLGYFANLRPYHNWLQLVININTSTIILVSFHVLGHEYRGLLACSVCAYHRDETEEGERSISDIQSLADSPFQFSYADEENNLIERFKQWFEEILVTGLDYWNKSL